MFESFESEHLSRGMSPKSVNNRLALLQQWLSVGRDDEPEVLSVRHD
jgi:hypothetical protein